MEKSKHRIDHIKDTYAYKLLVDYSMNKFNITF